MRVDCALTKAERGRLAELEDQIGDAWHQAGLALVAIRDERLYRENYNTIEEYARDEHGWGKSHLYRLINAALVRRNLEESLSTKGGHLPILPSNERQVRALAALSPADQVTAWRNAVDEAGEEPPARLVEAHAKPLRAAKLQPAYAPEPDDEDDHTDVLDSLSPVGLQSIVDDLQDADRQLRQACKLYLTADKETAAARKLYGAAGCSEAVAKLAEALAASKAMQKDLARRMVARN